MKPFLILDYSTDRREHVHTAPWLPGPRPVRTCLVLDGEPLPDPGAFDGVIHTGSALSVVDDAQFQEAAEAFIRRAVALGVPQVGICYGHQLLCRALLGRAAVRHCPGGPEIGWLPVRTTPEGRARFGWGEAFRVFQFHFDEVVALPDGAVVLATTAACPVQAFHDPARRLLGTQFHPEFDGPSGNEEYHGSAAWLERLGLDVDRLISGPTAGPDGLDVPGLFRTFLLGEPAVSLDRSRGRGRMGAGPTAP